MEQVKRLERDLSGLTAEREKSAEDSAPEWKTDAVSREEEEVYNRAESINRSGEAGDRPGFDGEIRERDARSMVNRAAETGDGAEPEGQERGASGGGESREERLALAVQLERMDRAASAQAGLEPGQDGRQRSGDALSRSGALAGGLPPVGTADGTRTAGGGSGGASVPGGELLWTEQADRAFRRDSRRYDGGFYLY